MLEVNKVLAEIGADRVPQILVWNKIDLTEAGPGSNWTSMIKSAGFASVPARA